ncbi:hypothetical protein BSKO_13855 [Bryopsis sp. KO-2023]|nr:hypothetical protein BSKO_13855 [Bryopsis sp. KO-2023]
MFRSHTFWRVCRCVILSIISCWKCTENCLTPFFCFCFFSTVVQENSDVPGQQQGSQIPIDSNIKKVGDDVRGQVQDEAALLAIWEPFLFTRLTSLSDFQIPNPLAGSNGRFQSSSTNGQFQTGNGQFKTSNGQFQNGNGQFQPNNGQFQASNGLFESFFFGR